MFGRKASYKQESLPKDSLKQLAGDSTRP